MRSRYLLVAGATTAALLSSAPAFAQLQPAIIIAFTGAASSVPLGSWTSAAAALFIVVLAATIFRRRRAGRPMHPGAWLAVVAAVGAAAIAGLPDAIRSAHAIVQPPLMLLTSPASVTIGPGFANITAVNQTGQNITLLSVTLANPGANQIIDTPPTTCLAGLVLAPGATCIVQTNVLS